MRPGLVSVITPTWQRHDALLDRCMPSVFSQTYPAVEHVIVSDGPDRKCAERVSLDLWRRPLKTRPVQFDALFEHIDGAVDYGSRARNRAIGLAEGEFIAYLDDDNAYRQEHVRLLVDALLANPAADFAYSRMQVHPTGQLIGSEPPAYGQVDTSLLMHRAGVPQRLGWWPLPADLQGDKHAPDWGVVERWLNAGARWVHVPQVTVDYWSRG